MTRKDFELIASVLQRGFREGATLLTVARKMADALAQQNPNFDRERFLAACGVK